MSPAACAVGALVAGWLLVTIIGHFPPLQIRINRADGLHLIPRWNFFAPNPGNRDYALVVRDRCRDGRTSEWRNAPVDDPRPPFAFLWHPQKRATKIVNDAVQSIKFLQQHERVTDSGLPFTLPYLLLLNAAAKVPSRLPDSVEFQFAVIESTGHEQRALACTFLSSFHRR